MPRTPSAPEPVGPFDPSRFRARPLAERRHLVEARDFALPVALDATAREVLDSLPDFLGARALRGLAAAVAAARQRGSPVLWGLGGHVPKVGLGPLLVDLAGRGLVQGFVLNGSAAIHDAEIALRGSTSEDVGAGLFEGTYGASEETGLLFAEAARRASEDEVGLGTALGRVLLEQEPPRAGDSILCHAARHALPVTVHVALGTDTVHMHPACDGAAVGAATQRDFLRLAALVEGLDEGVYVNCGSAVILPEVFLKAVALVHNARAAEGRGAERIRIRTGNLDMLRQYRPRVNVLDRPAVEGFDVAGHHELTLPLLRLAILAAVETETASGGGGAR